MILYEKLGLPTQGVKKGKTGYSTAAGELDKLRGLHPIIDLITQYREVVKLKNTYVDTLPKLVDKNSRVHTTFNLTIAPTGRLSSADLRRHSCSTERVRDSLGKGIRISIRHTDDRQPLFLLQHITLYADQPYLLIDAEAGRMTGQAPLPETRNIAPVAILPGQNGRLSIPGNEPRILDAPFDNDDWVGVTERKWTGAPGAVSVSGTASDGTFPRACISSLLPVGAPPAATVGPVRFLRLLLGAACR